MSVGRGRDADGSKEKGKKASHLLVAVVLGLLRPETRLNFIHPPLGQLSFSRGR